MADVKLSRRVLEAAVCWLEAGPLPHEDAGRPPLTGYLATLTAAARALLAAMSPASVDEVHDYLNRSCGYGDGERASRRQAWRAAEARARKLANWQDEP